AIDASCGQSAHLSRITAQVVTKTPTCLPTNNPPCHAKRTGSSNAAQFLADSDMRAIRSSGRGPQPNRQRECDTCQRRVNAWFEHEQPQRAPSIKKGDRRVTPARLRRHRTTDQPATPPGRYTSLPVLPRISVYSRSGASPAKNSRPHTPKAGTESGVRLATAISWLSASWLRTHSANGSRGVTKERCDSREAA